MRSTLSAVVVLLCAAASSSFVTNQALSRASSSLSRVSVSRAFSMEYIPDGLSKAQWDKIKAKEKQTKKLKMDGTSGMKFRSRSMADFLEGREKGIYKYNMPLEGDVKKLLREGKIKPEDVPYMQRPGGRPDNSDLKKGPFKNFKLPWAKEEVNGNGW